MADPTSTSFVLNIKSSTSASAGEKVKVTNLTKGGTIYSEFNNKGECIINPKDNGQTSWVSGDSLVATVQGRLKGVGTATLTTKGVKISITTSADTSTADVSL